MDVITEAEPELFLKYEHIPWDKYIKIEKAIDQDKWAQVYSIAWRTRFNRILLSAIF